jgi:hypothetical protein
MIIEVGARGVGVGIGVGVMVVLELWSYSLKGLKQLYYWKQKCLGIPIPDISMIDNVITRMFIS